jgi:hypothetical protein
MVHARKMKVISLGTIFIGKCAAALISTKKEFADCRVTHTNRSLNQPLYPNSLALAKAASASVVRPVALRARPLLFQTSASFGLILIASSYALMASSYLPWKKRTFPLLFHVSASCELISKAFSRVSIAYSYLPWLPKATP